MNILPFSKPRDPEDTEQYAIILSIELKRLGKEALLNRVSGILIQPIIDEMINDLSRINEEISRQRMESLT